MKQTILVKDQMPSVWNPKQYLQKPPVLFENLALTDDPQTDTRFNNYNNYGVISKPKSWVKPADLAHLNKTAAARFNIGSAALSPIKLANSGMVNKG